MPPQSLAPELILHSLDLYSLPEHKFVLYSDDSHEFVEPHVVRHSSLRTFSLVSPIFRAWAQQQLFGSVHFQDVHDLHRFLTCMKKLDHERRAELCALVRTVRFGLTGQWHCPSSNGAIGRLLTVCENVEELWLYQSRVSVQELNKGANIKSLHLNSCIVENLSRRKAVMSFPKAEYFMAFAMHLVDIAPSEFLASATFPALRSLAMGDFYTLGKEEKTRHCGVRWEIVKQLTSLALQSLSDRADDDALSHYPNLTLLDAPATLFADPSVFPESTRPYPIVIKHLPPNLRILRIDGSLMEENMRRYRDGDKAIREDAGKQVNHIRNMISARSTEPLDELIISKQLFESAPEHWTILKGKEARKVTVLSEPDHDHPKCVLLDRPEPTFHALARRIMSSTAPEVY